VLLAVACSSSSTPPPEPAKPEPTPTTSPKKYDIKPVDTPHQPKPEELGPAVDVRTGLEALCASIPDDSVQRTQPQKEAYIRGALFQYPNPDVIKMWVAFGDISPEDRRLRFRTELDKAGIGACHLYDLMPAAPTRQAS